MLNEFKNVSYMVINLEKEKFTYCGSCAAKCSENAVACMSCGVPPKKGVNFCNSCGSSRIKDAIFCVKCKYSFAKEIASNPTFVSSGSGEINQDPVSSGTAILWYLICYPVGYSQWGQGTKGWVSVIAMIATSGFAAIILLIDYIMCYNAQKSRVLGEWEFFPKA